MVEKVVGNLFTISGGWSPLGDGTVTYETRPKNRLSSFMKFLLIKNIELKINIEFQ